jgi:hypothetical protein
MVGKSRDIGEPSQDEPDGFHWINGGEQAPVLIIIQTIPQKVGTPLELREHVA